MNLRSVILRDWKAYESARFDFPAPRGDRNVVLIGGRNGFGKTTLFEAIALGLFGRDGLRLVQRAGAAADEERLKITYREFLQRALNRRALPAGRLSCEVALHFEDEVGKPIEIERTWYFTEAGALRPGQNGESLKIFTGLERRPLVPPRMEADQEAWYRDWIAHTFLPAHLANFFLFDGEYASAYAERDMGRQVRDGIEGLLGLIWLRRLAESLREYAQRKRNEVRRGLNAQAIEQAEREAAVLEEEVSAAEARLDEISHALAESERERDALTGWLTDFGGGTQASLQDLIQQKADHERALATSQDRLSQIAEQDLPLALAGRDLHQRVLQRLDRERRREHWLASVRQTQARVNSVLEQIAKELATIEPPLTARQTTSMQEAVRRALERLWQPPPVEVAEEPRHAHATGSTHDDIQVRLAEAARVSSETINTLLRTMAQASRSKREVNDAIEASQSSAPQLEDKRKRIRELNAKIETLRVEEGEKRNILASRKPLLDQKRAEIARQTKALDQSQRPARLAARAEEVAAMLDALHAEALTLQTDAIAEEMTRAIQAMAHRKDMFRQVEITDQREIRLLGPQGEDLRDLDLSAGEKQVFTQALFHAVASVSQRAFPLIIDTPLGRLDEEHRLNVLRHIAQRKGQVILISTDSEVVGPYLDAIRDRVLKAYRLENRTEGEVGKSWPVEGYFPGQGL